MTTPLLSTFSVPDSPKLKIVCSRFWPYSSTTSFAVRDLAEALVNEGAHVEVVTGGWDKAGPATFQFRNFPVQRIYRSSSSPLGGYRYLKNLKRYLSNSQAEGIIFFDALYEFKHLVKRLAGQFRLTVRVHDHQFLQRPKPRPNQQRDLGLIGLADRVIVESDRARAGLESLGMAPEKLVVVDDVVLPVDLTADSMSSQPIARQAIGAAHPMLTLAPGQRLVICAAAMCGDQGSLDLIDAWQTVIVKYPSAKLWIVGQGPSAGRVWDRIKASRLTDSIVMLGQFDDLSDAFRAANVYVHPWRSDGSCSMLCRAIAAGLCPVVCRPLADRMRLVENQTAIVAEAEAPQSLAHALCRAFEYPDDSIQIGLAAAGWAGDKDDVKRNLRYYLPPFKNP